MTKIESLAWEAAKRKAQQKLRDESADDGWLTKEEEDQRDAIVRRFRGE